ncbi:MAG: dihydrodipicolinate synthase family protein, partial [Candidatus Woesebacteria bacterium]|nr:dihydrodipicolinate synthase family protein [Candidatus Woesebacteria bacterium]
VGAHGVVSVASNVAPKQVSRMVRAFAAGDLKGALRLHSKLYPLFKDLFIESNPGPVKAALALMGVIAEEYRLPLCPLSDRSREILARTLRETGLL